MDLRPLLLGFVPHAVQTHRTMAPVGCARAVAGASTTGNPVGRDCPIINGGQRTALIGDDATDFLPSYLLQ